MQQYDVIVIGGGPGGYKAAAYAASQGSRTALVEKDLLGGTCLNRGCVPTKCLCAAAERLLDIAGAGEYGIAAPAPAADFAAAQRRAADIVGSLRSDVEAVLEKVDIYRGEARLGEGRTVITDGEFMKASRIIIATGSRPAPFPAEGAENVIDSDAFLALDTLPERVVIVGGGVIGLEFASIIAAYGKSVTVLEFCREILPGFDTAVAKRLRTYLGKRGIKIITGARVTSVSHDRTVTYEAKGKEATVEADLVISAVGRRPVLPDGLDSAGVELTERGFIKTDDSYGTTAEGIYAIGDVNGKCMLAHAAEAQARIVTGKAASIGVVPGVVFTVPECATVGLNADAEDGLLSASVPYGSNAKALAAGHTEGVVKLVARPDGTIVGCQAVGAHAADLIAEAAVAIDAGYTVGRLAYNTVSAHPGLSELLSEAAAHLA